MPSKKVLQVLTTNYVAVERIRASEAGVGVVAPQRCWVFPITSLCLNRAAMLDASEPMSESEAIIRQRCFTIRVYSVSLRRLGAPHQHRPGTYVLTQDRDTQPELETRVRMGSLNSGSDGDIARVIHVWTRWGCIALAIQQPSFCGSGSCTWKLRLCKAKD